MSKNVEESQADGEVESQLPENNELGIPNTKVAKNFLKG